MSKPRGITIMEAVDTQDYSHDEMENLVFIEKPAYDSLMVEAEKLALAVNKLTGERMAAYGKYYNQFECDGYKALEEWKVFKEKLK